MRFTRWILAAAALGLAACSPQPAADTAQAEPEARYVGLWAVSEEMCARPAWRFAAHEVSTLGEVHCAFNDVANVGDRYAIAAMCTAEAPPAPYDVALEVSNNPRAMVVSGGPWAGPTSLVYCGPLPHQ
jgi:hypothetical protein